VEISEDRKHMRTRNEPGKWSLSGVEPKTFSTLNASVPEFVPGQSFRVGTSPSVAPETEQPQLYGKDLESVDAASEMSSRLEEMSISTTTAAEPAGSEDASSAAVVGDCGDDTLADQHAAIERLNTPADDKQYGKK